MDNFSIKHRTFFYPKRNYFSSNMDIFFIKHGTLFYPTWNHFLSNTELPPHPHLPPYPPYPPILPLPRRKTRVLGIPFFCPLIFLVTHLYMFLLRSRGYKRIHRPTLCFSIRLTIVETQPNQTKQVCINLH